MRQHHHIHICTRAGQPRPDLMWVCIRCRRWRWCACALPWRSYRSLRQYPCHAHLHTCKLYTLYLHAPQGDSGVAMRPCGNWATAYQLWKRSVRLNEPYHVNLHRLWCYVWTWAVHMSCSQTVEAAWLQSPLSASFQSFKLGFLRAEQ